LCSRLSAPGHAVKNVQVPFCFAVDACAIFWRVGTS
jgi:hypothetical protein